MKWELVVRWPHTVKEQGEPCHFVQTSIQPSGTVIIELGQVGGRWEPGLREKAPPPPRLWSNCKLRLTSRWKWAILYIKLHPSYCPCEYDNLKHENRCIQGHQALNSLGKWEIQWYSGCHCVVNFAGLKRLCFWCLFSHTLCIFATTHRSGRNCPTTRQISKPEVTCND